MALLNPGLYSFYYGIIQDTFNSQYADPAILYSEARKTWTTEGRILERFIAALCAYTSYTKYTAQGLSHDEAGNKVSVFLQGMLADTGVDSSHMLGMTKSIFERMDDLRDALAAK